MDIKKVQVITERIIKKVPQELRTAARQERKALIDATKQNPIDTAFKAANGQFSYVNNNKLNNVLNGINSQLAKEAYEARKASEFIHRQPLGFMEKSSEIDVVKASHVMA